MPPSCALATTASGISDCPDEKHHEEPCCTSNEVPGGAFYESYDGHSSDNGYGTATFGETISTFRLDRYEVTVARFLQFVAALSADGGGFLPEPGSGKHSHLNGGQGLVDSRGGADAGAYEQGWQPSWNSDLRQLAADPSLLDCPNALGTWTQGGSLPINCITWVEAYAFCIWDGGFLPSEAEWNYAAAGGGEQRYYPWSPSLEEQQAMAAFDTTATCNNANFTPESPCIPGELGGGFPAGVGLTSRPPDAGGGDSLWAQADMAGNVVEWTLDFYWAKDPASCQDCARTSPPPDAGPVEAGVVPRVQRGGSFVSNALGIRTVQRGSSPQRDRSYVAGVRCARAP